MTPLLPPLAGMNPVRLRTEGWFTDCVGSDMPINLQRQVRVIHRCQMRAVILRRVNIVGDINLFARPTAGTVIEDSTDSEFVFVHAPQCTPHTLHHAVTVHPRFPLRQQRGIGAFCEHPEQAPRRATTIG